MVGWCARLSFRLDVSLMVCLAALVSILLRGTIIIRTCDQHKNLYNPQFLLAIWVFAIYQVLLG